MHTAALKLDGSVVAWGNNSKGQIGDGTVAANLGPVQVLGAGGAGFLDDIASVTAGANHTAALMNDETVWTWGSNNNGQLGLDSIDTSAHSVPEQVKGSEGVGWFENCTLISSGYDCVLALKTDGTMWAWGENYYGQLGDGTSFNDRDTPVLSGGPFNLYTD
jgi:alpha-tubulin suppressor-like RCC1 family protein